MQRESFSRDTAPLDAFDIHLYVQAHSFRKKSEGNPGIRPGSANREGSERRAKSPFFCLQIPGKVMVGSEGLEPTNIVDSVEVSFRTRNIARVKDCRQIEMK
jgi:hypothetical protein